MLQSAQDGDIAGIVAMLERRDVSIDATDSVGATVWHHAAACGQVEVLQYLWYSDPTGVTRVDTNSLNVWQYASQNAQVVVMRYLFRVHHDLWVMKMSRATAILASVRSENLTQLQYLHQECGVPLRVTTTFSELSLLHIAATVGWCEGLAYIHSTHELNACINLQDTRTGHTALYAAAQHGHLNTAKLLCRKFKADVNLAAFDGTTPIAIARGHGHMHIMRYLSNRPRVQVQPICLYANSNGPNTEATVLAMRKCIPCSLAACGIVAKRACGRCRVVKYCSRQCQRLDWTQHKHWCGRNINASMSDLPA
jgi:hypothetical protein